VDRLCVKTTNFKCTTSVLPWTRKKKKKKVSITIIAYYKNILKKLEVICTSWGLYNSPDGPNGVAALDEAVDMAGVTFMKTFEWSCWNITKHEVNLTNVRLGCLKL
jgi:hypothetical protein